MPDYLPHAHFKIIIQRMWKQKFLVLIILIFLNFLKCNCDEVSIDYRLPNNSIPLRYELKLKVNAEVGFETFFGDVKIHIKILSKSDLITLHSSDLHIKSIKLFNLMLPFNYDVSRDFLNVKLPSEVEAGNEIILDISYVGQFQKEATKGFVLASYNDTNYIFTHFEPIFARMCLPCYDEPAIRAVFSVTVEHDSSYEALSNMPVVSSDKTDDNHTVTTFQDTPPMQSYLLAFFIHKFAFIENNHTRVPQRIFARPELIERQFFKNLIGNLSVILEAFEEYFDVPFSLPKIDHVIAPNFKSAIENWGLTGYNEAVEAVWEIAGIKTVFHEMAVS